jgi:hypothetical protein
MDNTEDLIKIADDLITKTRDKPLSDLERSILRSILKGEKSQEIAQNLNYPLRHIRQVSIIMLHILSEVLDQRITEGRINVFNNIRSLLEKQREKQLLLARYYEDITCTQASELFENLSEQQQNIAQRIFIELIELTDLIEIQDTPRQIDKMALVETLETTEYSKDLIESVLQILTEVDLINYHQKDDIILLEINDALIPRWKLLEKWLNEGRNLIKLGRSFETEAKEWQVLGKRDDDLLKGMRLNLATNFSPDYAYFSFSVLAAEFVLKSVRKRKTNDAVAKIKQSLGDCRSDLTKVQETIELLEATEPDSEEFLQCLSNLRSRASNLFPYSGIIREIVRQLTEDTNLSQ